MGSFAPAYGLLYFAVFSILVTNRNVSRVLFGRDGNYSDYLLEKYVMNAEQIKSCLVDFQTSVLSKSRTGQRDPKRTKYYPV
uniref:Uncharacterized protein n=1 Tax=Solanum lycopersicum TaxID=4081 RepID=A0A3Q7FSK4_SOLLC